MYNAAIVSTGYDIQGFFRDEMPYGIERKKSGEWMVFNKDYKQVWNKQTCVLPFPLESGSELLTVYSVLDENTLAFLSDFDTDRVRRGADSQIYMVWLYGKGTSPLVISQDFLKNIDLYLAKCKVVANLLLPKTV